MSEHLKGRHLGPAPGGFFFALKGFEDLPYVCEHASEHDLAFLLKTGKVWMGNAERPGGWQEIFSPKDVPAFSSEQESDYERCVDYVEYSPFLPEFYYISTSFRGKRHMRRSSNRKHSLEKLRGWA